MERSSEEVGSRGLDKLDHRKGRLPRGRGESPWACEMVHAQRDSPRQNAETEVMPYTSGNWLARSRDASDSVGRSSINETD